MKCVWIRTLGASRAKSSESESCSYAIISKDEDGSGVRGAGEEEADVEDDGDVGHEPGCVRGEATVHTSPPADSSENSTSKTLLLISASYRSFSSSAFLQKYRRVSSGASRHSLATSTETSFWCFPREKKLFAIACDRNRMNAFDGFFFRRGFLLGFADWRRFKEDGLEKEISPAIFP